MKWTKTLTPLILFTLCFAILSFGPIDSSQLDSNSIPLVAAIVAIISGIFLDRKHTMTRKIDFLVEDMSQSMIVCLLVIFYLSSLFSFFLQKIGAIDAAIKLGLLLIPESFLLPGLFITVGLFSLAIGSSMGGIVAFMPFAKGLLQKTSYPPELLGGLVISAAMLGDNLSIVSETSLAASNISGSKIRDKFIENGKLVLPSFLLTLVLYFLLAGNYEVSPKEQLTAFSTKDFLQILPYSLVFLPLVFDIHVLAVLFLGVILSWIIGLSQGSFHFYESLNFFFEGFIEQKSMVSVSILVLLIAALAGQLVRSHGLQDFMKSLQEKSFSKRKTEFLVAFCSAIFDSIVAINTVAIITVGPILKPLAERSGVSPKRYASLLDLFSCIPQGILPHMPQVLLTASILEINTIRLLPYFYYQYIIFFVAIFSILKTNPSQAETRSL